MSSNDVPLAFVPNHTNYLNCYGSLILTQLAKQQKASLLTDFILSSQGQEMHCHRAVLAAACPYFEAMFSSGLIEVQQGKAEMNSFDFRILKYIVEVMYGNCPSLPWEDVETLLDACESLQLNDLKKELELYIESNVTAGNCLVWMKNAETFHLDEVAAKAKMLMVSEFGMVSKSEDFLKLSYADFVDIVQNVEKSISDGDQILYAAIRWVSADEEHRKSLMIDLLKLVNLEKCSSDSIDNVTKDTSELFQEPDVMRLVYHSVLPRLKESEWNLKSMKSQSVMLLGGMAGYNSKCYTECWRWNASFGNISWEKFTDIPEWVVGKRTSFVALPNGFAVLCGGESGTMNAKYDLKVDSWTLLPQTPEKLGDTVAFYMDGKVHVLDGGKFQSYDARTNKMYTLNLQTLQWSRGPDLLIEQYRPIATAYE